MSSSFAESETVSSPSASFSSDEDSRGASRRRPFIPSNIPLIACRHSQSRHTNILRCHGVLTGTPLRAQYVYTVHTGVPPLLQPSPWPLAAGTAKPLAHRTLPVSFLEHSWSLSQKCRRASRSFFREANNPPPPFVRRRRHTGSSSGDIDYTCRDLLVCLDDEGVYFKLFSERR